PALKRAQQIFHELGMDNTEIRNGVLFYVGVSDHTFAIIGDQGIDQVVEPDFWDCTKDLVISHFKNRRFREGLVSGILRAGERLKQHFPRMHDDTNELSNDISKG
nr:TPM domain-containing protein [Flavobacterium sp.]